MKAGLFICDHVSLKYQAQFDDYPTMFADLFPDFEWVLYDVCNNHFPESLEECDLYIATGSKHSVYDDLPWVSKLKKVIVQLYQQQKYFIGVCFGHQLIGEALGGKVRKSSNGWCVGVHQFEIITHKNWMIPSAKTVNLLMMCQDQIVELPKDATVLAKSEWCPVAMLTVGETILGIQAHPEFSKAYNQVLMEDRVERMGQDVVSKGIESLKNEIQQDIIQRWILSYISK